MRLVLDTNILGLCSAGSDGQSGQDISRLAKESFRLGDMR
jgi:hypothetical protein